jgi:hypothetical protein
MLIAAVPGWKVIAECADDAARAVRELHPGVLVLP